MWRILGQTFDCDGFAVDGRSDRYDRLDDGRATGSRLAGGTVTTRAQGEGAIEGVANDYLVGGPFEPSFVFSRFNASGAVPPRDAARLGGQRRQRKLSTCSCPSSG